MSKQIQIDSKINESSWLALEALAERTNRETGELLSEAVAQYVNRQPVQPEGLKVRPEVLEALQISLDQYAELGQLLADS